MKACCANCVHFRREDLSGRHIPGATALDGRCGLRNPSKQEGLTRWCREADWCDQHQWPPVPALPDDNSDLL